MDPRRFSFGERELSRLENLTASFITSVHDESVQDTHLSEREVWGDDDDGDLEYVDEIDDDDRYFGICL